MTALIKVESINALDVCDNIERTKDMAKKLMLTKHYQKIGEDGIFAICMTAQANNINQLDALNGELYYVQGRVGMSAEAMNKYIRKAGHSISLKSLTDNGCTVIGKRKDNGDTAEVTYGLEDMKSAGKNYDKNKKDMFFARAISRLKRILFPDLLTKVYEKSEIDEIARDEKEFEVTQLKQEKNYFTKQIEIENLTVTQVIELQTLFNQCSPEYQKTLRNFMVKKYNSDVFDMVPVYEYEKLKGPLQLKADEYQKSLAEAEMANVTKEVTQE